MKFNIGDKVRFITSRNSIPDYYYEAPEIPTDRIQHGNTDLGETYKKNGAEIIDIFVGRYNLVEWKDVNEKTVRLCFLDDVLSLEKPIEPIKPISEYKVAVDWEEIKSKPK